MQGYRFYYYILNLCLRIYLQYNNIRICISCFFLWCFTDIVNWQYWWYWRYFKGHILGLIRPGKCKLISIKQHNIFNQRLSNQQNMQIHKIQIHKIRRAQYSVYGQYQNTQYNNTKIHHISDHHFACEIFTVKSNHQFLPFPKRWCYFQYYLAKGGSKSL